ncbi:3-oxoacyl-[acyl-carrier protein] reductase [Rhizobium sp. RU35A]|uniref:SDR family NAD(P)-dependent oxidoreductase n=1 Tax=Rhizobium sp. RU35A TaxID=1907414 RepID=UPI000955B9B2|nr:SDR family oxidoreductase [Rhizobium sp. RU35A]SIQ45186.1 3-oxoacyl-[acyl-carrier protein] reductase [Rhizobium sp. RU35A]
MTSTGELYSSLRYRVVIVTGGSRGLGREMVLELVSAGAHLAVIGSQAGPALDDTVAEANRSGPGRAMALVADVSDNDQCEAAVAATLAAFGRVDVLVNNAGLGMRRISERFNTTPTRFWETDPAAWRDIIDTNVNGPFQMARAVVPHMLAQGFGKIINISTSDQTMVRRGYAPYGPSKAALEAASRVWAQDLAGTGIDVNVYLPGGAADTDLLPPSPDKKGADGNLLPATIMRRAIRWLAADESNGITGARFIARLWDETLPPADAAHLARSPAVDKPAIL